MPKSHQPKVHLVGSFPATTSEDAMRKTCTGLKGQLHAIPDGEPGWRWNFTIGLVQNVATQNPEIGGVFRGYDEKYDPLPVPDSTKEEVEDMLSKIASITLDLGYAKDAIESYKTFRKLREEGVIAQDVRFQICLPGASSFAIFVKPAYQYAMEDLCFQAMRRDVIKIMQEIPPQDVAVQFDIASDFIKMELQKNPSRLETMRADFHPPKEDAMERYTAQYTDLISLVDRVAEVGLHICCGNINNKAIFVPKDMAVMVKLANTIAGRISRPLNWVHFGILPEWTEETCYAPLKDLQQGIDVYLGVVYPEDKEGAQNRVNFARKYLPEFGVAPPCGLARTSPAGCDSVMETMLALSVA